MTNDKRCILAAHCSNAGGPKCNALCGAWIGVHGHNGRGGRVAAAGLPADYARYTLANSPVRSEQPKAYRNVELYAGTFNRQFDPDEGDRTVDRRIKSLYLFSAEPGTGKTTTAAALINEYITHHYIGAIKRGLMPLERPAYFLDVNAWQTLFLGFNRSPVPADVAEQHAAEYYMRQLRAMRAPFAVLDDIGIRSASDAFRADLHVIINHRLGDALPTVFTSNVLLADLKSVFDARLADRVRDMCVEVAFEGSSKRGLRKNV